MSEQRIPARSDLPGEMTWDLSSLYAGDAEWEAALAAFSKRLQPLLALKGKLAESADRLTEPLERLHTYAHLKNDEDLGDPTHEGMFDRSKSLYNETFPQLAWITCLRTTCRAASTTTSSTRSTTPSRSLRNSPQRNENPCQMHGPTGASRNLTSRPCRP